MDVSKEIVVASDPLRMLLLSAVEASKLPAGGGTDNMPEGAVEGFVMEVKAHAIEETGDVLNLVRQLNARTRVIEEMAYEPCSVSTLEGFEVTLSSSPLEAIPVPFAAFANHFLYSYSLGVRSLAPIEEPLALFGFRWEGRDALGTPFSGRRSLLRTLGYAKCPRFGAQPHTFVHTGQLQLDTPYGDLRGTLYFGRERRTPSAPANPAEVLDRLLDGLSPASHPSLVKVSFGPVGLNTPSSSLPADAGREGHAYENCFGEMGRPC
ncbi:MAG: hypothetical protein Q8P67_16925 [archaeon]|nr:hypothetical protein [archaeon]